MRNSDLYKNKTKIIAFGAVLMWGVWTLVPVVMAALAALIAIVYYGIQALSLPSWALGSGAAALTLAILLTLTLQDGPKARLLRTLFFAAKIAGLFLVTAGAAGVLFTNLPALPVDAPSHVAKMDARMSTLAFGIVEAFAWITVFFLPVGLCCLTLQRVWSELYHGQK